MHSELAKAMLVQKGKKVKDGGWMRRKRESIEGVREIEGMEGTEDMARIWFLTDDGSMGPKN
jgi:hypothetical protein